MKTAPEAPAASGFWEQRTGWSPLKQLLLLEPLPGGSRWTAAFGSLLLFAFLVQVVTGVLLTMNYAPSVETAWASVHFIQHDVPLGAFIRGVHHWGSGAMVILLLVHVVQVFVWGAYKKPRELTWMVGVLLLFCTLGLAFTGYLLPWDQKAYWATKVGLGMISTVPLIGDGLRTLLQGGPDLGNLTLTRFFAIHGFILPGLLILLVVVHLYLFRLHGVTPAWWQSEAQLKATEEPFWPKQALKDGVFALLFLAALGAWVYSHAAPLEDQADPSRPYEARPEWYFMFLFQLLRHFEGPYEVVGTFVLPAVFFLALFFWPFIERYFAVLTSLVFRGRRPDPTPVRDPRRRPVAIGLLALGSAGLVGLTIYANATDVRMKEPEIAKANAPAPAEQAGTLQRVDVAKVYNGNCAACHGIDGTGSKGRPAMPNIPDFTSVAWQLSQTELDITHRILEGSERQEGKAQVMPAYRNVLSQPQVMALAIYVRAFSVAALEGTAAAQAKPSAVPSPAAPSQVQAGMPAADVYRNYCLLCHDTDGRGGIVRKAMPAIPNFTDAKWNAEHKDAELRQVILQGKPPFMPPMKDRLGPADADRLVALVRGFAQKQVVRVEPPKPPAPAVRPAVVPRPAPAPKARPAEAADRGEVARISAAAGLYRQYCLMCHGTDGRGAQMRAGMPTIPDFTDRAWQQGVDSPRLAVSILEGKGQFMPVFRGRVTDDQAQDLVAYVRAFGPVRAAAAPALPAGDFEKRYRALESQWEELQRQLDELKPPPRKP